MKITLFCRFDYLSRFTHFREHFWPAVLVRGTPLQFFSSEEEEEDWCGIPVVSLAVLAPEKEV